MTHVVQNGTTGANGHLAVKHVVKVNKKGAVLMSVRISLTTFKPEHAESNFLMFHTIHGQLGANAVQLVLVVLW